MILQVNAKCSDCFSATLLDREGGAVLKRYDGYVPDIMPGEHCGDYVELDIDMDTGKILNWKKPSKKAIKEFIDGEES